MDIVSEGQFQEYDYNQEHFECEWKVIYGTNILCDSTVYVCKRGA